MDDAGEHIVMEQQEIVSRALRNVAVNPSVITNATLETKNVCILQSIPTATDTPAHASEQIVKRSTTSAGPATRNAPTSTPDRDAKLNASMKTGANTRRCMPMVL